MGIRFLRRLHAGDLPFSKRSIGVVKRILVLSDERGVVFRGKTGSHRGAGEEPDLGWFVGSVERGGRLYVFAANILGEEAWGTRARRIVEAISRDLRILPAAEPIER